MLQQIQIQSDIKSLCTEYGSDFSTAHGRENDINRHKNISKHKGYKWMLHNDKEN